MKKSEKLIDSVSPLVREIVLALKCILPNVRGAVKFMEHTHTSVVVGLLMGFVVCTAEHVIELPMFHFSETYIKHFPLKFSTSCHVNLAGNKRQIKQASMPHCRDYLLKSSIVKGRFILN